MAWVTGIVVYVLVWWITLFAVLPLWVTPAEPDDLDAPFAWREDREGFSTNVKALARQMGYE